MLSFISWFFTRTYVLKNKQGDLTNYWILPWHQTLVAENVGLVSLKGCPSWVRDIRVSGNRLCNFVGFPAKATHLDITHNQYKTLIGCPKSVTHLRVSNNPLETLEGCSPNVVSLGCSYTHLKNFIGCSQKVKFVVAAFCLLTSLEGLPMRGMERLYASYNKIQTCESVPYVRNLDLSCNLLKHTRGLPQTGIDELCVSNNQIVDLHIDGDVKKIRCCGNPLKGVEFGLSVRFFQALKTGLRADQLPFRIQETILD